MGDVDKCDVDMCIVCVKSTNSTIRWNRQIVSKQAKSINQITDEKGISPFYWITVTYLIAIVISYTSTNRLSESRHSLRTHVPQSLLSNEAGGVVSMLTLKRRFR